MPSFTETETEEQKTGSTASTSDLRTPLLSGHSTGSGPGPDPDPGSGPGTGLDDERKDAVVPVGNGANHHFNLDEIHPLLSTMMTKEWFSDIYSMAELPTPYDYKSCRENLYTALALGCALCASILYVLGGSKDGAIYVVGGVAVNLMQTFFFTKETISFFSKIHSQKQLAAVSLFFALFSTCVTAFATFQMSDNEPAWASIESLLVFAGNLPQNLYGMFESIKRLLDSHRDNPMAREHLIKALSDIVDTEPTLKGTVPAPRGAIHKMANQAVGFGVGVFLSLSQVGYIRSSVDFITTHSGSNIAGLTLGLLTNLPGLCISMFISGKTLAEKVIDSTYDLGQWMLRKASGQPVPASTTRELVFFGAKLGVGAMFAGFANFSESTSKHLYYDDPELPFIPSTAEFDAIIQVAVDQGCRIFNGVVAIMGSDQNIDYLNKAYVEKPSTDEVRLKIKEMVKVVNTSSDITSIVQIAVKANYIQPSIVSSGWGIFKSGTKAATPPTNDANGYHALTQAEPDHEANLVFGHH
jgi:hypothetical protein